MKVHGNFIDVLGNRRHVAVLNQQGYAWSPDAKV